MKKIIYLFLALVVLTELAGCKKFLNVTPIDDRSGNNYWKSREDVEAFTSGMYAGFRSKISGWNNFLTTAIDSRCAPVQIFSTNDIGKGFLTNNIRTANDNSLWLPNLFGGIWDWKPWYKIIQNANIMYKEVGDMDANLMSDGDRKMYQAEAVFLRNLCYFYMVRLYGDVAYYTDAYHEKPLPRTDQVEVMDKCIADMMAVKNDLPVRYDDQNKNGNRPMRGSAIALLMHMNMWAASFAKEKTAYYQATLTLAQELSTYTQYSLVRPLNVENNKKLFKGGTNEVLFEVISGFNYGERIHEYAYPSDFYSHYPLKGNSAIQQSNGYWTVDYMKILFPSGETDLRKDVWLENYDLGTRAFQLKKYTNTFISGTNFNVYNDDNIVIFRLADMLLLAAEAANELGDDPTAQTYVNQVRDRAGKTPLTSAGNALSYDIYVERSRELFCEGAFYFDLVRTRRIISGGTDSGANKLKPGATISVADFNDGAWTWSINPAALTGNPYMILNNYWR